MAKFTPKEFTASQVLNIFNLRAADVRTLTDYRYKGKTYQFQFDFEAEKKGERVLNIIRIGRSAQQLDKKVGFFKY